MKTFDCLVVGKGLIGSAAAKHLSMHCNNIAIVGPDEPSDAKKGIVFSSHYDEARVQRIIGKDSEWTSLNLESAKRYNAMQKETGIQFHNPVGCLYINPYGQDDYLSHAHELSTKFSLDFKYFEDTSSLKKDFPFFSFPSSSKGLFEKYPSGYINPKLLIKTQLSIFQKNKSFVFNDTVENIRIENNVFIIETLENNQYKAKKILLAPGSFTNFFQLTSKKLKLTLKGENVLLCLLQGKELERLSQMPSLLYEINNQNLEGIYMLPPVKYPDGNYYLKLGCNLPEDIFFDSLEQIQNWFRNDRGNDHIKKLQDAAMAIIPDIEAEKYISKRCIITRTAHGKPYIGEIEKNLFVATGGNGYSAMCSDEIGFIAASMITNETFPKNYNSDNFSPVFL